MQRCNNNMDSWQEKPLVTFCEQPRDERQVPAPREKKGDREATNQENAPLLSGPRGGPQTPLIQPLVSSIHGQRQPRSCLLARRWPALTDSLPFVSFRVRDGRVQRRRRGLPDQAVWEDHPRAGGRRRHGSFDLSVYMVLGSSAQWQQQLD
jgi:hypothetical protein